jgi:regulatory protein
MDVDGEPVGLIPEPLLHEYGLSSGSVVDEPVLLVLLRAGKVATALALANVFLAHRPRSTAEVRNRLRRAKCDDETIQTVVDALVAQNLLDDTRFASMWVDSRTAFSPRSARLLAQELRQKGVDRQSIDEVIATLPASDETGAAVVAGRKKLRTFSRLAEQEFHHKMTGFLSRRGFSYGTIEPAVRLLWSEAQENL